MLCLLLRRSCPCLPARYRLGPSGPTALSTKKRKKNPSPVIEEATLMWHAHAGVERFASIHTYKWQYTHMHRCTHERIYCTIHCCLVDVIGGVGRTSVIPRLHTLAHTHQPSSNSCPLTLDDPSCATEALSSSPGVPVLLFWVPVQELRVLLLCDSGSCVSCHSPLPPLSAFLFKSSSSFTYV